MNDAAERIALVHEWLEAVDLVLLRPQAWSRTGEPMPLPLSALDAIHLATALIWRDRIGPRAHTARTIQLRKSSQTARPQFLRFS